MLPVPLLFPRPDALPGLGSVGLGGSTVGLGSVSWKADGSGSGRRLRIKEAKDSFEASVLKSLVVGGTLLGNCASFDGGDEGGGVGGRGRKKGIFRGDSSGDFVVLCDSTSSSVALLFFFGFVAVPASVVLLSLGSSAMCDEPFVAVLSDEADTGT